MLKEGEIRIVEWREIFKMDDDEDSPVWTYYSSSCD